MNIGKENEMIEFKRSASELKEGLRSVSAILNKRRKGFLYFGVKDNGDIVDVDPGRTTSRDISSAMRSRIKPECFFSVEEKASDDGKMFIEVAFNGDRAPYSADGRYYLSGFPMKTGR